MRPLLKSSFSFCFFVTHFFLTVPELQFAIGRENIDAFCSETESNSSNASLVCLFVYVQRSKKKAKSLLYFIF